MVKTVGSVTNIQGSAVPFWENRVHKDRPALRSSDSKTIVLLPVVKEEVTPEEEQTGTTGSGNANDEGMPVNRYRGGVYRIVSEILMQRSVP